MSIEAVSLVLNQSKSTGRAKVVLIGIANHLGDHGAWPSISTLARYANASERSVKRDIQELIELGELVVEVNKSPMGGQYKTNLYWITLGVTESLAGVTDLPSGVTDWVSRGDSSGKSGVTPVGTQNIILTIKETYNQSFEEFWNHYPKKLNKTEAKQAFLKAIKKTKPETIIEGVITYSKKRDLPEHQFIPYPATWLNKARWENETDTQPKTSWKLGKIE